MAEEAPPALGRWLCAARRAFFVVLAVCAASVASAQGATKSAAWTTLSPAEQGILAPLAGQWDRLDAEDRQRWLGVAKRYPKMTPTGQKRTQTRMKKWAALSPREREQARDKYKSMKRQGNDQELRREWERYQALTPEQRQALVPQKERGDKAKSKKKKSQPKPAAATGKLSQ